MTSYEAILAGGEHGSAIIPGESAASRLVQMIEGKLTPRMPYKEDPLSRSEIELIRRWIDAGARRRRRRMPRRRGTCASPTSSRPCPVSGAVAAVAFDPARGASPSAATNRCI